MLSCGTCKEMRPVTQFGPNYKWVKSICKACDNSRVKKVRGARQTTAEQALYLREGKELAELWFIDCMKRFKQSMQAPSKDPDVQDALRRWSFDTCLTAPSICRFYELPEEAAEAWPMQYREMVLKATQAQEIFPARYGTYYKFDNTAPLPGPGDGGRLKDILRDYMDEANVTVEFLVSH